MFKSVRHNLKKKEHRVKVWVLWPNLPLCSSVSVYRLLMVAKLRELPIIEEYWMTLWLNLSSFMAIRWLFFWLKRDYLQSMVRLRLNRKVDCMDLGSRLEAFRSLKLFLDLAQRVSWILLFTFAEFRSNNLELLHMNGMCWEIVVSIDIPYLQSYRTIRQMFFEG